jgi:hypothetical protein
MSRNISSRQETGGGFSKPVAHASSEVQRGVVQVLSKRSNEICGLRLPPAAGRTQVKVLDATILALPTVRLPEHCDAMRRLSGRPYYSRLCYPSCAGRRALMTRSCADRGAIDGNFAAIEYLSNNLDVAAVNPFACFYYLRPFKKAAQGEIDGSDKRRFRRSLMVPLASKSDNRK